jgi:hypothetical protein
MCIEKQGNYSEKLCTVELYIPVVSILINELILSDLSSYHCSQTYVCIISDLFATSLLIIYLQALWRCHAKWWLEIQSYFTENVHWHCGHVAEMINCTTYVSFTNLYTTYISINSTTSTIALVLFLLLLHNKICHINIITEEIRFYKMQLMADTKCNEWSSLKRKNMFHTHIDLHI